MEDQEPDEPEELNSLWMRYLLSKQDTLIPRSCLKCDHGFHTRSRFIRLCKNCRQDSE